MSSCCVGASDSRPSPWQQPSPTPRFPFFLLLSFLYLHFSFNLTHSMWLSLSWFDSKLYHQPQIHHSPTLISTIFHHCLHSFNLFSLILPLKHALFSQITQCFTTQTQAPNLTFLNLVMGYSFAISLLEFASLPSRLPFGYLFAPSFHHLLSLQISPPMKSPWAWRERKLHLWGPIDTFWRSLASGYLYFPFGLLGFGVLNCYNYLGFWGTSWHISTIGRKTTTSRPSSLATSKHVETVASPSTVPPIWASRLR